MKRSINHSVSRDVVFTFKRWANKSYAVFSSLGRQIRIGQLKVIIGALLSSKSRVIRKGISGFLNGLMRSMPDSVIVKEGEIPGFIQNPITLILFPVFVLFYFSLSLEGQVRQSQLFFFFQALFRMPARIFAIVLLIMLFMDDSSIAQSDTTIILEEMTISGNRLTIPFEEASRNIQIIDRKQIEISPVQSVAELLTYVPGVDIRQRGPVGVQTDIGIRGGTFEQTLILVNGIKLSDPQTGHHVMSLPFNMDNVVRVEVLKGPGARIYGQNAFSGAVNFITMIPDERGISFRGYGGSFGSYGGALTLALPGKKYSQYVSFGGDASDGYRYNTDYKLIKFFYQSELEIWDGKLELVVGWTGRNFGANGFYASPDYHDQYEEVQTGLTSVSFHKQEGVIGYTSRVYWRGNHDRYLFVRTNPDVYENFHKTNVLGAEWNGYAHSVAGVTGIGLEYRREMIRGDWVRGGVNSKSNLDGYFRDQVGLYLEQKFKLAGIIDVTPGLYLNWYSDFGWSVFPGLDMGYNMTKNLRLYANMGRSYRVPTFYDQYYQSPVESGNEYLKPEQAWTYEVGVRYGTPTITAEANVFYRRADDLIDWVYSELDSLWEARNFQKSNALGIELAFAVDFGSIYNGDFLLQRITFSYNYIDQKLDETEPVKSRYALENIRNQLIAGIDHRIFGKLKNSFRFRLIDRLEQDPYILLDDRIYWEQNENFSIFLEATNLTNRSYTEVMTPMPGRWIRAGIKLKVGFSGNDTMR